MNINYEKLKYDLAIQLSAIRFKKALEADDDKTPQDLLLLEIFASTYEQYCKIPNKDIAALFDSEL